MRNFTENECIPGIEMEYQLMQQLTSLLPLQSINEYINGVIGDENIVISLMGPEREGISYPTEAELLAKFKHAQTIAVEGKQEEVTNEPLIAALPARGKIVQTKENPLFGTTIYTLSNGVEVVIKETAYKKDEILMRASSKGGSTLFADNDVYNLKVLNQVTDLGGLSDFPAITLTKMLAGKNVSCRTTIGDDYEGLNGTSVPADIRTLFELIYLYFTAPRSDDDAFASFKERLQGQLENLRLNPMIAFNDTITKALYNNQVRAKRIESEDLPKIRYDRIMNMYRERFADASDFVFTFVGNIEKDSMVLLMEQYLAVLPSLKRVEQGDTNRMPERRKGNYTNHFHKTLETPKATILTLYTGQMDYDFETVLTASFLKQILDLVYMEKVRENESGSYGVNTSINVSAFPKGQTTLQIYFDTDPALKDKLMTIVKDELMSIVNTGPQDIDFTKTRENMLKRHDEAMQENSYWLGAIDTYHFRGYDWHTGYKTSLESITPEKIRTFAKSVIEQGNYIEVVMEP
jgi:zinc protease